MRQYLHTHTLTHAQLQIISADKKVKPIINKNSVNSAEGS